MRIGFHVRLENITLVITIYDTANLVLNIQKEMPDLKRKYHN